MGGAVQTEPAGTWPRWNSPGLAWADGLAAALVIGTLAGLLPAIRAARLSPTQAVLTV